MAQSNPTFTYLCLLDDMNLAGDVVLDEFSVRSHSAEQIQATIHGGDDLSPSPAEQARISLYALFPWASVSLPLKRPKRTLSRWASMEASQRAKLEFVYRHSGRTSTWPFEPLLRTLNLMKTSPGPVLARHFYLTPGTGIQTSAQVTKIVRAVPVTNAYPPDGEEEPYLSDYNLTPDDSLTFEEMRARLDRSLSRVPAKSDPSNTHLRIAVHHFERADQELAFYPESFQVIDPLLAYEGALEALMLLEDENNEKKRKGTKQSRRKDVQRLADRIGTVLSGTPSQVRDFVRRVHWLRSKIVHSVRTVEEIRTLIMLHPNKAIDDTVRRGLSTPKGKYSTLLLKGGAFPGFLVNLRELTRRCICYFCDQYLAGHSHEDTIATLDKQA